MSDLWREGVSVSVFEVGQAFFGDGPSEGHDFPIPVLGVSEDAAPYELVWDDDERGVIRYRRGYKAWDETGWTYWHVPEGSA